MSNPIECICCDATSPGSMDPLPPECCWVCPACAEELEKLAAAREAS